MESSTILPVLSDTSTYYLLVGIGVLLFVFLAWFLFFRKSTRKRQVPTFESSFKGLNKSDSAEVVSQDFQSLDKDKILEKTAESNSSLSKESTQEAPLAPPPELLISKSNWWTALSKSRERFFKVNGSDLANLKEALEEACLVSDLGVTNTQEALNSLNWGEIGKLSESERLPQAKLKLAEVIRPWISKSAVGNSTHWPDLVASNIASDAKENDVFVPRVIWFVGVNGVGKTTSIAKMAAELKRRGKSVLLAAGDTFRAAAGEQLEIWAQRLEVPCIRGQSGADSSAVLFDALESAKAKKIEYVLCDSAGRLHNQNQLMEALQKNRRVLEKSVPGAPHEVLLVLDANTGQNMINQAEQFIQSVGVTGLILTKLDGTARGGAIIAVARKTELPIRRLGLGERTEDFVAFDAERFSEALLGTGAEY